MTDSSFSEDDFLAATELVARRDTALSSLAAAIVVAVATGIAGDSRSFAKLFGVEHALVVREINMMSAPDAPVEITRRDARTQRTFLELTVKGTALTAGIEAIP